MRIHTDWSTQGFALRPAADRVGPFPRRGFLESWWRLRERGEVMLVEGYDAFLPLHSDGETIRFAGEADLTDYHAPLGGEAEVLLSEFVSALPSGTALSFDSLPEEAAVVIAAGLRSGGTSPTVRRHDTAVVLDLPGSYEEYLAGLAKKQRHEIRRKGRRFAEAFGEPRLVRDRSPEGFETFVAMHRTAEGDKGRFMTPEIEDFFGRLLALGGAVIDVVVGDSGEPLAAAFGFEDVAAYYLYNSAFAPEAAAGSPGVVLLDRLIQSVVEHGRSRLDFLKGDEEYKYRLGGTARPLYVVEATA